MLRKQLSVLLATVLLTLGGDLVFAQDKTGDSETERVSAVRTEIAKLGTGLDARIKLKLRDNRNLEGYISDANSDSFTVVDLKTGIPTVVAYPQVGT